MDETYKLCYIDGIWAYFTTQNVEDQWGDDWNDAPYEHNAGRPYTDFDNKGKPRWDVDRVAIETGLATPADNAHYNSSFSVQDINRMDTPWLRPDRWSSDKERDVRIWAGTPYPEFVRLIQESGGAVYERIGS